MRSGTRAEGGPPIQRALMLVDRANDRAASVIFCASEDDLRRADEFMNNMTMRPAEGRAPVSKCTKSPSTRISYRRGDSSAERRR
jgi:hypothetical protein